MPGNVNCLQQMESSEEPFALLFPQMKLVEVVNILGRPCSNNEEERLPIPLCPHYKVPFVIARPSAHSLVTATNELRYWLTKVLPQIAFAPQLNFLPKRQLAKLQCAIADALWQNRPMWRSKHLLLVHHPQGSQVRSFSLQGSDNRLLNPFASFSHRRHARQTWQLLFQQDQLTAQSWLDTV